MICFEVYVNGERVCRAGLEDAVVLSATLSWVKRQDGTALSVGGFVPIGTHGSRQSGDADEPREQTVYGDDDMRESKRKYFEQLKAEFEGPND